MVNVVENARMSKSIPSRSSNTAPGSDPPRPTPTVPGGSHRSRGGKSVPPPAPTAWPPPSGRSCQPQWHPEDPDPSASCFGYLHGLHRRREITPRRHAIHSLNRLFFKSRSNLDRHAVNTGRALLALTLRYASHTMCLEISNGFTCDLDSLTWLLPATRLTTKRTRTTRPLRSARVTGSPLLQGGPSPCRASVLSPSQISCLGSPFHRPASHTDRHHHSEGFPRFVPAPRPSSRHLHAGRPPGQ